MQILKFGGAAVQDAEQIRNVAQIITQYAEEPYMVVVSAMGKTTNALEGILADYWYQRGGQANLEALKSSHQGVVKKLMGDQSLLYEELENLWMDLEFYLDNAPEYPYNYAYDQVVSFGELAATKILSRYLQQTIPNKWLDARNLVLTTDHHRSAEVRWAETLQAIQRRLKPLLERMPVISQGFIGATPQGITTTLGREGSDYSASIFAYALKADQVTVWKDVPGILNADPRTFQDTIKFDTLSYQEAMEMTFYGAKVLHPRTIKPLQQEGIPLLVRSFREPAKPGTRIDLAGQAPTQAPVIIAKPQQMLVELSTKDYGFIAANNLSRIFRELAHIGLTLNLMNTSAITFSFCSDYEPEKLEQLRANLEDSFQVTARALLSMLTIRHYNRAIVDQLTRNETVLLENSSGSTIQMVLQREAI